MPEVGRTPVKFEKPPLIEVACGVTFSLPQALKTAHIGMYWARIKDAFPTIQDAQPLAAVAELTGLAASASGSLNLQLSDMPPLRRAWFISADEGSLIQLQDDRFLFNWRSARGDGPESYPSYQRVIAEFYGKWQDFTAFLDSVGLGGPTITQMELVYVNAISDLGNSNDGIDTVLVDHIRARGEERFLPKPEVFKWQTSYQLPNDCGRLHIMAQSALDVRTKMPNLRLDLTARGLPPNMGKDGITVWFDMAHEWITFGFADVTNRSVQTNWWRRTS